MVSTSTSDALHAFLRSRQSVRRFTAEPVPAQAVGRILESATWAPSAHNRQPWRFALVIAREQKEAVAAAMGERLRADRLADGDSAALVEADVARSRARIVEAPLLVFVFMSMEHMDAYPDAKRQAAERAMAMQSTAMATQNLLLAAHAEGLGACIMCAPLFCPSEVARSLSVPPDWLAQSLVVMGYPANSRERKGRMPIERVVAGPRGPGDHAAGEPGFSPG